MGAALYMNSFTHTCTLNTPKMEWDKWMMRAQFLMLATPLHTTIKNIRCDTVASLKKKKKRKTSLNGPMKFNSNNFFLFIFCERKIWCQLYWKRQFLEQQIVSWHDEIFIHLFLDELFIVHSFVQETAIVELSFVVVIVSCKCHYRYCASVHTLPIGVFGEFGHVNVCMSNDWCVSGSAVVFLFWFACESEQTWIEVF